MHVHAVSMKKHSGNPLHVTKKQRYVDVTQSFIFLQVQEKILCSQSLSHPLGVSKTGPEYPSGTLEMPYSVPEENYVTEDRKSRGRIDV
jgi:hypothetical protein